MATVGFKGLMFTLTSRPK